MKVRDQPGPKSIPISKTTLQDNGFEPVTLQSWAWSLNDKAIYCPIDCPIDFERNRSFPKKLCQFAINPPKHYMIFFVMGDTQVSMESNYKKTLLWAMAQ